MIRQSKTLLLKVINADPQDETHLLPTQLVLGVSTSYENGRGYVFLAPPHDKPKSIPKFVSSRFVPVLSPYVENFISDQIIEALNKPTD